MNVQAAVIAAAILGGVVALAALLWSYPSILLYILLGLIAVMAYAALYLIVASKTRPEEPTLPPDAGDDPPAR